MYLYCKFGLYITTTLSYSNYCIVLTFIMYVRVLYSAYISCSSVYVPGGVGVLQRAPTIRIPEAVALDEEATHFAFGAISTVKSSKRLRKKLESFGFC